MPPAIIRLLTLRFYYFPLRITIRTSRPQQQLKPCRKKEKDETSLSMSALLIILSVSKHRKSPGEDDIPGLPLFIPCFSNVPGQISMFSQDYDDKTDLKAEALYGRTDSEQISKNLTAVMIRITPNIGQHYDPQYRCPEEPPRRVNTKTMIVSSSSISLRRICH